MRPAASFAAAVLLLCLPAAAGAQRRVGAPAAMRVGMGQSRSQAFRPPNPPRQNQNRQRQSQNQQRQYQNQARPYQNQQQYPGTRAAPDYSSGYGAQSPGYNRPGYPNAGRPAYAAPGASPPGHLGDWLNRHQGLRLSQQEQLLRNDPSFNRLPQAQPQRLVQQLHDLNQMSPAQRQ